MSSLVPTGFEAYARVFPWIVRYQAFQEDEKFRWAELAAINGRDMHPLVEFDLLATPAPGHGPSPVEPGQGPLGPMFGTEILDLAEILRDFTRTPELCWYCAWEGYAGIEERESGAKVHRPIRKYFLSSGPIEEVISFSAGEGPDDWWRGEGPDIWWPDDRAWCVGSDTDLEASYVGGSAACIDSVLGSGALEALPISVDDPYSDGRRT